MISFENYERKIDKIQAVLAEYGIKDLEEAQAQKDALAAALKPLLA